MNKIGSTLVAALALALTLSPSIASAAPGANGTACMASADCATGFCVDGVCCNVACGGQCEACAVAGSLGVCTPVLGLPYGARPACSDGGSLCAARMCDGSNRSACMGFKNGASVVCAAGSCADGVASLESRCDGAGACPAVTKVSCAPYACDVTGCKTACASSADCGAGFVCGSGKCLAVSASCSADGTLAISSSGQTYDCSPYRCGSSGTCNTACTSNSDCSSPNVCDTATGRCKDPNDKGLATPGQSTSSGCALSRGRDLEASAVALAFGALLGLGLMRRRRARSGGNG
jgi:hypothetical protein